MLFAVVLHRETRVNGDVLVARLALGEKNLPSSRQWSPVARARRRALRHSLRHRQCLASRQRRGGTRTRISSHQTVPYQKSQTRVPASKGPSVPSHRSRSCALGSSIHPNPHKRLDGHPSPQSPTFDSKSDQLFLVYRNSESSPPVVHAYYSHHHHTT